MVIKNHGFTALITITALIHAYAGIFFASFGICVIAAVLAFVALVVGLHISDVKGDVTWQVTQKTK